MGVAELLEEEFDEKKLESSVASNTGDQHSFRCKLSDIGTGVTCRKGRRPGVPNQCDVLFGRTERMTVCGIVDGHGSNGHWASYWATQIALAISLSEACSNETLPSEFLINKIFHCVNEGL